MRDCIDTGPTGPAALARPRVLTRTDGTYRGQIASGITEVYRYGDETLFDRMLLAGQIDGRQHAAADNLHGLWVAAGLAPRAGARYGEAGGRSTQAGEVTPHDEFRAALRLLTAAQAWAVSDMLWGSVLPLSRVPALRAGLDVLAGEA